MKTNRITEIVTDTLRRGGIEKFPTSAMDWLVQDIEAKLEADAGKRIRKFMTPALIAKAISQSYSKRAARTSYATAAPKASPPAVNPTQPVMGN
jgi:hypothetical protein